MPDTVKIQRFEKALAAAEFDVVAAISPENTWYLSETVLETQKTMPTRLVIVVWAKGSPPVFIGATNEQIQVSQQCWIQDRRHYVEYKESPMAFLAQAITELGAARGVVGIEKRFLAVAWYEELARLLPGARITEAAPFFDRVRAVKTPDEIRRMEQAAQATDRAIRTVFEEVRPGMTEREVGIRLTSELIRHGAEWQFSQMLGAGANTCPTHPRPTDYVLQSGDLMRTDFGGLFPGGYLSDLSRTIVVGKPSPRQVEVFDIHWEEQQRLIEMMRPGTLCSDIYHAHRQRWEELGWPMKRAHIGHSLGLGLHEHPVFMPSEELPLEPGMIMCIEPNHLFPGVEKYHVEDTVLVTEGAPRVLSRSADWSRLLTPGA